MLAPLYRFVLLFAFGRMFRGELLTAQKWCAVLPGADRVVRAELLRRARARGIPCSAI